MVDDLSRIESVYGSVAEYNRVKNDIHYQNDNVYDKKHSDSLNKKHEEYLEEVAALELEPSELAKKLRLAYEDSAKKYKNDYYESSKRYQVYLQDSMSQIANQYGKVFQNQNDVSTEMEPGTFSISYSYGTSQIYHNIINNLTKDEFMHIYADMGQIATYNRLPKYRDASPSSDKVHTISNTSLGELRRNEFDRWGVPNEDAHMILKKLRDDRIAKAEAILFQNNVDSEQLEKE